MLLGLTYRLVLFVVDLVLVRTSSDAQLRAEVLALRHQLRARERKVGKPAWQPSDRILLAGLSRGSRAAALYRTPRANSIAERFMGTCRREVLDHLLIFSARHLEAVIKEFLIHYHQARPHQGLDQRCPDPAPAVIPLPVVSKIVPRG